MFLFYQFLLALAELIALVVVAIAFVVMCFRIARWANRRGGP